MSLARVYMNHLKIPLSDCLMILHPTTLKIASMLRNWTSCLITLRNHRFTVILMRVRYSFDSSVARLSVTVLNTADPVLAATVEDLEIQELETSVTDFTVPDFVMRLQVRNFFTP